MLTYQEHAAIWASDVNRDLNTILMEATDKVKEAFHQNLCQEDVERISLRFHATLDFAAGELNYGQWARIMKEHAIK